MDSVRLKVAGVLVIAFLACFGVACGLVGEDDEASSSSVKVVSLSFGSSIEPDGRVSVANFVFPPTIQRMNAVLILEGAQEGQEVTGKWYRLGQLASVADARTVPAEGVEVRSATVKLDSTSVKDGQSRTTFSLDSGGSAFPVDSWLLRVYIGETLIRTAGFTVVPANLLAASGPGPGPGPGPTPASGAGPTATPAFTTYTVVAGDTLQSLAQRFKPAAEETNAFINRVAQLNSIQATATLQPGQQLRIPR